MASDPNGYGFSPIHLYEQINCIKYQNYLHVLTYENQNNFRLVTNGNEFNKILKEIAIKQVNFCQRTLSAPIILLYYLYGSNMRAFKFKVNPSIFGPKNDTDTRKMMRFN